MKTIILITSIIFAGFATNAQQTHEAKITIRVIDESGNPITNVPVSSSTIDSYREGTAWWGGVANYKDITVYTDGSGIATMVVPKTESSLTYGARNFPGYYWGGGGYNFKKSIAGQWQPWNPTVELVLKAIGVQVPMYARQVRERKIPNQGKPIGFDLMVGDWIHPYGNGELSDFVFQYDNVITKTIANTAPTYNGHTRTWMREVYDNRLTVKFSNEDDGVQFVSSMGGGLPLPRLAPIGGYQSTLSKRDWLELTTNRVDLPHPALFTVAHSDYQKDANYFFRVRTKKDANSKVVSALYGKVYGDFKIVSNNGLTEINFTYYLNSEPNSRNMEFDLKKNLFKNLKPLEQVTAP